MNQYINSNSIKGKKMQHIANGPAIFLLISTLIAGPATSSFIVYGQSNETILHQKTYLKSSQTLIRLKKIMRKLNQ